MLYTGKMDGIKTVLKPVLFNKTVISSFSKDPFFAPLVLAPKLCFQFETLEIMMGRNLLVRIGHTGYIFIKTFCLKH